MDMEKTRRYRKNLGTKKGDSLLVYFDENADYYLFIEKEYGAWEIIKLTGRENAEYWYLDNWFLGYRTLMYKQITNKEKRMLR